MTPKTQWIHILNKHHLFLLFPAVSLLFMITSYSTSTSFPAITISTDTMFNKTVDRLEHGKSRIAICLVGGARRFELTGPSIIKNVLKVYPNADLFLHSPLDSDAFKLSILKAAPNIAAIRVFSPKHIQETDLHKRLLSYKDSPNGFQGFLQYFNMVEGYLSMINFYQQRNNFTYDWIIRTRVDGYWSAPLEPNIFIPGHYVVPLRSSYGGLNDRFGVGDLNLSKVALSRFSLLPKLYSLGFHRLNSERAFKAQLTTFGVPYIIKRIPFCVMSDRIYKFPPGKWHEPVASISSLGPLSGAKCRPCNHVCQGPCVKKAIFKTIGWGCPDWEDGRLKICDASRKYEQGWEEEYDRVAGEELAAARKKLSALKLEQCVSDFEVIKKKASVWDAPTPIELCSHR